ncbi:MAG: hypothetical protein IT320_06325 [Anaerolineae bacterium]|nr:hypothetical protein [Anaerolineae bacterium]
MSDDKQKPKDGKDKEAPPLQNTTSVSWRGRTPASKADDDPHGDYAFGKKNEANDDEGEDVRDVKASTKSPDKEDHDEGRSRLLGEGQERGKADEDDDVRQSG